MLLLDADVVIDILRNHPPAVAWFHGLTETPSVPGLVVMELIQGVPNGAELRKVQRTVATLLVVWPREADCQLALMYYTNFRLSHGLDLVDAMNAALAVGLSADLCTFNKKHYNMLPGVNIVQPYIR